ncbi:MAG TPA: universal stress protein, partial [Thermodesulfobacteriota bacterium]|nr:universal stress protein [Thermodesulfobacteriota bacterium]
GADRGDQAAGVAGGQVVPEHGPPGAVDPAGRGVGDHGPQGGQVVRPPEPIEIVEMGAVIDAATTHYEEQFRKIVAKVKDKDLVLHTDILTGNPADQIVRYAHEKKCDVVILGHRGKSRVEDWLLGSVPKRVSSYAPCNVIIVK